MEVQVIDPTGSNENGASEGCRAIILKLERFKINRKQNIPPNAILKCQQFLLSCDHQPTNNNPKKSTDVHSQIGNRQHILITASHHRSTDQTASKAFFHAKKKRKYLIKSDTGNFSGNISSTYVSFSLINYTRSPFCNQMCDLKGSLL